MIRLFKIIQERSCQLTTLQLVFGSWMGGDRDENPNVTAKITQEVIFYQDGRLQTYMKKNLLKLFKNYQCTSVQILLKKIRKQS